MTQNIDWFVAPTGIRGDGSRENPFHDPWAAFRRAEPGDTIHIAAGTYYGRLDRSSWIIQAPMITVLGGYSSDFTSRNPWKTPSVFAAWNGYEYAREVNIIAGREDHSGLVLDGVCFDSAGINRYADTKDGGITSTPNSGGPIAAFGSDRVTIRNCVFTNSGTGGVELQGSDSRFENNLLINIIGTSMLHLRSSSQMIEKPIVVTDNTFCFLHDVGEPAGQGGPQAHGIIVRCPSVIDNNVFVSCGNSAISNYVDPGFVGIQNNVFFATPRDIVEHHVDGSKFEIKEKNLDELEDLSFKSSAANVVQDPAMIGIPSTWIDTYSRDLLARYAMPPIEAANAIRSAAGLPAIGASDLDSPEKKGGLAPRFPITAIATFSSGARAGFHSTENQVSITPRRPEPIPEYRHIEFASILSPDAGLANTRVALRVGLGTSVNQSVLADASFETHLAVRAYDPGTDDNSIFVLVPRHSFALRQYNESANYSRGTDVEKTYYVQGVVRTDTTTTRQKATILVESIVPGPTFTPSIPPRPKGRDWFVRSGSSGGDGSREKPFRDPFQALEKAAAGDTLHVSAGDYFGKLRSGKWLLTTKYLAMLGGYDAEFKTRDPWANLTRFALDEEEKAKGQPPGKILYSEENSDGLLLDGFVFDGSSWNTYTNGSLDLTTSPVAPLIQLRGVESPITVRNCIFVNGSDSGVDLSCSALLFENNVILNTNGDALIVSVNAAGPAVIRNNTLLFASDPTERAGTGKSSARGTLIQLKGRGTFELESNVIGFADNYGIRAAVPQDNVSLKNNVFAVNLFNHLSDCNYLYSDESNWMRRVEADSSYALDGNRFGVPKLPLDAGFLDAALARLYTLPSRITPEEWTSIASGAGATVRPVQAQSGEECATTPGPTVNPSPTSSSGLDAIMARLNATSAKLKEARADATASRAADAPKYCTPYDYKRVVSLFTDEPDSVPGAHRKKLDIGVP